MVGGGSSVQEGDGGCLAHAVAFAVVVAVRGCRMLVGLVGCSEPQRLALLSGCQFGVGLRWKTALVATTTWDDQACYIWRQVAQCGTSSEDSASDILRSLRQPYARVYQ